MAARRGVMQLRQVVLQTTGFSAVPRQVAVATQSHGPAAFEGWHGISSGGSFANRRLHSESQATDDGHETHDYEKEKMTAEGGGSLEKSFDDHAAELKGKSGAVANDASAAAGEAKGHVSKEVDTAKDMFKDFPQKVSETATGLKEVGIEAAKAVKRDAGTLAGKAGLKPEEISATATDLKEVGIEAGKAAKRDSGKVAEKVGLKSDKIP